MKIHEYQAKQLLREAGVAMPQQHRRHHRRRSGRRVQAARRPARRGEGPDPRRRPRQGHDQRQSAAARRAARQEPPTKPQTVAGNLLGKKLVTIQTGPEGQDRQPRARRSRLRHRPRAVPGHRRRPRRGHAGADGLERRRHEHRRGRREDARADLQGTRSIPTPACSPTRSASCAAKLEPHRHERPLGREVHAGALQAVRRARLQPGRDQSAGRHEGAAS